MDGRKGGEGGIWMGEEEEREGYGWEKRRRRDMDGRRGGVVRGKK